MYKLMTLLRRKQGTTHEQFKAYYENVHSKMGDKYLPPYCKKYLRHYLTPIAPQMKAGQPPHPDFDAVVELWFDTEADCKAFEASVSAPELVKEIIADEDMFVDRSLIFRYRVEDHLSWGPPDPGKPSPKGRT